jgi:adenylate cyclase
MDRNELAARAGIGVDFVDRLIGLGILAEHPDEGFRTGDIHRIRFVRACEKAGMTADAIAGGIEAGKISLGFMDLPHYRFSTLTTTTYGELAAQFGMDFDFVRDFVQVNGFARPEPDDPIRDDEMEIFPLVAAATSIFSPEELLRSARVYVDAIRKISEAEAALFESHIIPSFEKQGLDRVKAIDMANEFGALITPMQEGMILALYRRMQERRWNQVTFEGIEGTLEELGLYKKPPRPPAFSFVDLAGYTRMTEEAGDEVVAKLAADMAQIVDRIAGEHSGQVVKWLGDGVMIYFRDPGPAAAATIEIVEAAPQRVGLPAHAGIAAGPVVIQEGDYFGRTVNMAARIAAHATAGQTLVSSEVASLATGGLRFRDLGPVELKGFQQPVPLFEALSTS